MDEKPQHKTLADVKVGDKVFVVHQRRRHSKDARSAFESVIRVGRKYAYLDGYRERAFDLITGHSVHGKDDNARLNGYGFDVYISDEDYRRKELELSEKARLKRRIVDRWNRLIDLPPDTVSKIHDILDEAGIFSGLASDE